MNTIDISLPNDLQAYVDQQIAERGYVTCGEYIRDLIRQDHDRQKLRSLVLEGAASPPSVVADDKFFDQLYQRLDKEARR